MDAAERRAFVAKHRTAVFGYARREHGPAMTVTYYILDGDDILVSTTAARGKARAVRRDPRVSLTVLDEAQPLGYLLVHANATVEDDPDAGVALGLRIAELATGAPLPDDARAGVAALMRAEGRVVLRLAPYRTFVTAPRRAGVANAKSDPPPASLPW